MAITRRTIAVDLPHAFQEAGQQPSLDDIASEPPKVSQEEIKEGKPADLNVIVVEGKAGPPPGDPVMEINEAVFGVSMAVDDALVEPIADTYRDDFPTPIRKGLRNFFRNLTEPVNFLNFLLQGKPLDAIKTFGRFAINTTLGIGGLIDWAKNDNFKLPYQRNGFANTLGYYGVGTGPFLVLPLVGATTLRDALGGLADTLVLPTAVGKPFDTLYYAVPAYTVNSLEWRIEFDDQLAEIKGAAVPYDLLKQYYLERREREINALRGIHTPTMDEQIEMDRRAEEAAAAAAAQRPVVEEAEPLSSTAGAPTGDNVDETEEDGAVAPPVGAAIGETHSPSISSLLVMAGY